MSFPPLLDTDELQAHRTHALQQGVQARLIEVAGKTVMVGSTSTSRSANASRAAGLIGGTASVTADPIDSRAAQPAGRQRRFAADQSQQQAVAESEAAVREAEAEAAAAERAAEQYATFQPQPTAHDDPVSRLGELASLRDKGALTQEEFESAKSKLLGP
jgi:Short C-terminal domain